MMVNILSTLVSLAWLIYVDFMNVYCYGQSSIEIMSANLGPDFSGPNSNNPANY